jgi:hypothetical protein
LPPSPRILFQTRGYHRPADRASRKSGFQWRIRSAVASICAAVARATARPSDCQSEAPGFVPRPIAN